MDYLEQRRKLRQMVQERLDYGRDYTDEEVEDTIDEVLMEQESLELCPVELRRRLRKELFDSLRRLAILQIFVEDSSVTEIMINGMDHIFVEQDGQLRELDRAFDSVEKLQDVIQQIVAGCNRVVNEASPIVDARLNNGSRVNIVMNPIALNGPIVTIRRFAGGSPVPGDTGEGGLQHFCQWRNGKRQDNIPKCSVRLYFGGRAGDHHRRQCGTTVAGSSESGSFRDS